MSSGTLITRLRDLGAATIALDIIFAESDRYNGNGVSADQALADTLRAGGVALGYALTFGASPINRPHACSTRSASP